MPAQNFFGLDVGSHSIKAVWLAKQGEKFKLIAYGKAETPLPGIFSDSPIDQENLAEAIKKLTEELKPTTDLVRIALPEAQIFSRVVEMPVLSDSELASAIKWEAEQYVPVPISEVTLSYEILSRSAKEEKGKKMEIFLVAAPTLLIEKYLKIIKMAGLSVLAIETEVIAAARSLINQDFAGLALLVVNIGASSTDFSVIRNGRIFLTRSISSGGVSLGRAIAQDLDFNLAQAEEYKKTYGLEEDKLDGKIFSSIKPVFDIIIEEIKKTLAFDMEKCPLDPVRLIILSGGTARMPGLVTFIADSLEIEVQLGNPWMDIEVSPAEEKELRENGSLYAVAVGLAKGEN